MGSIRVGTVAELANVYASGTDIDTAFVGNDVYAWDPASTDDDAIGEWPLGRWVESEFEVWSDAFREPDDTDDARCIERAGKYVNSVGGGRVNLRERVYNCATLSEEDDAYFCLITWFDNVQYRGQGPGTVLKFNTATKDLPGVGTGPMMFGRRSMGSNARFLDMTIYWNGIKLSASDVRRNFAGVFALEGGYNVLVSGIKFLGNPGNQCVMLKADSNTGQGWNIVENCEFVNGGSGLVGNFNYDHSDIFMNGYYNKVLNNRFWAERFVLGAPYEIHGSYGEAAGNIVEGYEYAGWIACDYEDATGIYIHHERYIDVLKGPSFGNQPSYVYGTIELSDCYMKQRTPGAAIVTTGDVESGSAVVTGLATTTGVEFGMYIVASGYPVGTRVLSVDSATQVTVNQNAISTNAGTSVTFSVIATYFLEAPKQVCDLLKYERNTLIGVHSNPQDTFALQANLTKHLVIRGNVFQTWSLRAISSGNTDLGDGYAFHELEIEDNSFIDCVESDNIASHQGVISVQQPSLSIRTLSVSRNKFAQSSSGSVRPLNFNVVVGAGAIEDNTVGSNMTLSMTLSAATVGVRLRHEQAIAPGSAVYCTPGSTWHDKATGIVYAKRPSGAGAWQKRTYGTAAPSSGTWAVGDECINTSPSAGGWERFVCVTAGTPGTWKGAGAIEA